MEKMEAEREFNEMLIKFEADQAQKEVDFERQRKKITEMEKEAKYHKRVKDLLRRELAKYFSMVEEANLMAQTLKRHFLFSLQLSDGIDANDD